MDAIAEAIDDTQWPDHQLRDELLGRWRTPRRRVARWTGRAGLVQALVAASWNIAWNTVESMVAGERSRTLPGDVLQTPPCSRIYAVSR
jgi:hypothetical protein